MILARTYRKILAFGLVGLLGIVPAPCGVRAKADGAEQARAMAKVLQQGTHNWVQAQGETDSDIHLWRAWKLPPDTSFEDYLLQLQYSDRDWHVLRHTRDRTLVQVRIEQHLGARVWRRVQQLEVRRVAPLAAMIQQSGGDAWLTEGAIWGVPVGAEGRDVVVVAALRFRADKNASHARSALQQPVQTLEQNAEFAQRILARLQMILP